MSDLVGTRIFGFLTHSFIIHVLHLGSQIYKGDLPFKIGRMIKKRRKFLKFCREI